MTKRSIIFLLLRIGVGFVFLYPPIAAINAPLEWNAYMPDFLSLLPVREFVLLHIAGAIEVIIALWILSGRQIFIPSVIASLFLLVFIFSNFDQFDVIFRNVGILTMTLSLALWSYDPEHKLYGR